MCAGSPSCPGMTTCPTCFGSFSFCDVTGTEADASETHLTAATRSGVQVSVRRYKHTHRVTHEVKLQHTGVQYEDRSPPKGHHTDVRNI